MFSIRKMVQKSLTWSKNWEVHFTDFHHCDIWREWVWPWLRWVKPSNRWGFHCYTLWILSYLDVWSPDTCGSHKIFTPALTRLKPVSSLCPDGSHGLNSGMFKATRTPKVMGTQGIQSSWWQKHMLCVGQWLALWPYSARHPGHLNVFHHSVTSSSLNPPLTTPLLMRLFRFLSLPGIS